MAPQQHFNYLQLPPEIRNMIMQHVLAPGDVYVRPSKPKPKAALATLRALVPSCREFERIINEIMCFVLGSIIGSLVLSMVYRSDAEPHWSPMLCFGFFLFVFAFPFFRTDRPCEALSRTFGPFIAGIISGKRMIGVRINLPGTTISLNIPHLICYTVLYIGFVLTLQITRGRLTACSPIAVVDIRGWKIYALDTFSGVGIMVHKFSLTTHSLGFDNIFDTCCKKFKDASEMTGLCKRAIKDEAAGNQPLKSLPEYQLLAACKQTHLEGQRQFYESNTFHLPPGPLAGTLQWLNNLRSEHRRMIKKVSVSFSYTDLLPAVLDAIDRRRMANPGNRSRRIENDVVKYLNNRVWQPKLGFLRKWKLLDSAQIECYENESGRYVIHATSAEVEKLIKYAMHCARISMKRELRSLIDIGGWQATRAWLAGGGALPGGFVETARATGHSDEAFMDRLHVLSKYRIR